MYVNDFFAEYKRQPSQHSIDDNNIYRIIEMVRQGIPYHLFQSFQKKSPFSQSEWSSFLHISERTMLRYEKEKKAFDTIHSEKIVEIMLLMRRGGEVFGNEENFNAWLNAENIALGHIKPKDLLDNTFGIGLIKDELTRIEHGVLA